MVLVGVGVLICRDTAVGVLELTPGIVDNIVDLAVVVVVNTDDVIIEGVLVGSPLWLGTSVSTASPRINIPSTSNSPNRVLLFIMFPFTSFLKTTQTQP